MPWILSGPNDNPLTGLIVFKEGYSVLEWVTPCLSVICAGIGLSVTVYVARRAREITSKQRDIADESKKIAREKLEYDLFDKRFKLIQSLISMINITTVHKTEGNIEKRRESFYNYFENTLSCPYLFEKKDSDILRKVRKSLQRMFVLESKSNHFRNDMSYFELRKHFTPKEAKEEFDKRKKYFDSNMATIPSKIMRKYTPKNIIVPPADAIYSDADLEDVYLKFSSKLSTTSPASHPEPQPTAPEQAQ